MRRKILVTGCGRSGTKYLSVLLRHLGLAVMHEKMGADGISSWLFGVRSVSVPWGPPSADYEFDHTFHLIRDPLSAIPSITTLKKEAWAYIYGGVPLSDSDPVLLRAAKYWLWWNESIEKMTSLRLKIEDMPEAVRTVCDELGISPDLSDAGRIPKDINTRRLGRPFHVYETRCINLGIVSAHSIIKKALSRRGPRFEDITWSDLEGLDAGLTERIRVKSQEYGYAL